MPKNESKAKTARKPLREVSNGIRSSKPSKNKVSENEDRVEDDALDRLLLVHSDLSTLIHQIDELVVQAVKLKVMSRKGRKEIESFTRVLSEMHSSLKPWVPRFQKVHCSPSMESENQLYQSFASKTVAAVNEDASNVVDCPDQTKTGSLVSAVNEDASNVVDSPDLTKTGSLVSPSPLVSWRADCTTEGGRQLFLLTPLPRSKALSSKPQGSSKSVLEKITSNTNVGIPSFFAISGDINDDLLEGVVIKPTPSKLSDSVATKMGSTRESGFVSPSKFSKRDCSMLVMTPCLKMSPPKSCVLLEPISESSHKDNDRVRKSTPFPIGIQNYSGSQISESSSSQGSESLALKYPELCGIQPTHKLGNGRKEVEASPAWLMSPPKTCVLMEPPAEKSLTNNTTNFHLPRTARVLNQQTNFSLVKENVVQGSCHLTKKSYNQELGDSVALLESTPMWKEFESTIRTGMRPGENTLKKELWTRFEAASTNGLHFDVSVLEETTQKGFLDRLDEVSCDETSSVPECL